MNVSGDYNRILEDKIKEELRWLEQEFYYLFKNKKTEVTENDIRTGNQILNNVIANLNINNNKDLLNLLTFTLDKIEEIFPEFF
ncbi:MAG: hypothetical protein ACFFA6_10715 [Promethearchaeota archaeon]